MAPDNSPMTQAEFEQALNAAVAQQTAAMQDRYGREIQSLRDQLARLSRPGNTASGNPGTTENILKSERLPDPEPFTGARYKLKPFIQQLRNKLQGNADRFPTEGSKLCYAHSRLAESAATMIYPLNPRDVNEFIQCLETLYGDPNEQATAQRKLNEMRQGNLNFPTYFMKFHRYARESGWNAAAQINRLIESLNPELQQTLVSVTLPDSLEETANLINRHYNNLLRLNVKTRNLTLVGLSPTQKTPVKDPNDMDIDPGSSGYAPKNSPERQKRLKEGRCFKCGSKDHLSPKCAVPVPKQSPRRQNIGENEQSSSNMSDELKDFFESPKESP
jgi:hypothetical protein